MTLFDQNVTGPANISLPYQFNQSLSSRSNTTKATFQVVFPSGKTPLYGCVDVKFSNSTNSTIMNNNTTVSNNMTDNNNNSNANGNGSTASSTSSAGQLIVSMMLGYVTLFLFLSLFLLY